MDSIVNAVCIVAILIVCHRIYYDIPRKQKLCIDFSNSCVMLTKSGRDVNSINSIVLDVDNNCDITSLTDLNSRILFINYLSKMAAAAQLMDKCELERARADLSGYGELHLKENNGHYRLYAGDKEVEAIVMKTSTDPSKIQVSLPMYLNMLFLILIEEKIEFSMLIREDFIPLYR